MIDTIVYVMVVLIDTTEVENRFQKLFEEADRQFRIEMMMRSSREAAQKASNKKNKIKIINIYRKED